MNKFYIFSALVFLFSCRKDKTPLPPEPPVTPINELITGDYKVYDTLGNFLYEMSMEYKLGGIENWDSIVFNNLDNQFNFSSIQSNPSNNLYTVQTKYISINSPFPTLNSNGKSWDVGSMNPVGKYDNIWRNDTIHWIYRKQNTPWWLSEGVPYVNITMKQFAVKQH
jgi:hypothetical protein